MSTVNPPATPAQWSPGRVISATLLVLLVGIGFYSAYRFSSVLFVLFVAIVLATALRPAVQWLQRWRIPPWLGILLVYALIAGALVGLMVVVAPLLFGQAQNLLFNAPLYYANALSFLRSLDNTLLQGLVDQAPPVLPFDVQSVGTSIELSTIGQAVGYAQAFGWTMFGLIALMLIVYFWILDREQIMRSSILLLPVAQRAGARELWDALESKVGAFVRGQSLLCLSIGIVSLCAFWIIGVPNFLLLAVLAGIFEAIPFVGPILTAIIAIVLTLAQAPEKIVWVVVACIIIQQLENALLVPRIMGRTVGVNAVVTLLAVTAFGSLLGVGGAIMAIPLAVVLHVLFEHWLRRAQQTPVAEVTGRDQVSVLRYEAQALASNLRSRIRDLPNRADQTCVEEELELVVIDLDRLLQTSSMSGASDPDARTNTLKPRGGA